MEGQSIVSKKVSSAISCKVGKHEYESPYMFGEPSSTGSCKETAKLCLNNADSIFQWHRCFEKSHQSHPYHHNVCVYVYVYVCVWPYVSVYLRDLASSLGHDALVYVFKQCVSSRNWLVPVLAKFFVRLARTSKFVICLRFKTLAPC